MIVEHPHALARTRMIRRQGAPAHRRLDTGIGLVGTYVPRACGIATFTRDLGEALADRWAGRVAVLALDHATPTDPATYPSEVIGRIRPGRVDGPALRAMLDAAGVGVVSLQHEFGIFNGPDGEQVLDLVDALQRPVVSTLHTVPVAPSAHQESVLTDLVRRSAATVVMSERGARMLRTRYGLDRAAIEVIPHGVPDLPFVDTGLAKARLGVADDQVILSFGLIGPNKGLERAIRALALALPTAPRARLVIAGRTHPELVATAGETYRTSLVELAERLGVAHRVTFVDRYLTTTELERWLLAADVFVTLYGDMGQVTSGTLAYAVASGRAVVSTAYEHARELLGDERGVLVPMEDDQAVADAFTRLLTDDPGRMAMRRRAWWHGRAMVWPAVAEAYATVLEGVLETPRAERLQTVAAP